MRVPVLLLAHQRRPNADARLPSPPTSAPLLVRDQSAGASLHRGCHLQGIGVMFMNDDPSPFTLLESDGQSKTVLGIRCQFVGGPGTSGRRGRRQHRRRPTRPVRRSRRCRRRVGARRTAARSPGTRRCRGLRQWAAGRRTSRCPRHGRPAHQAGGASFAIESLDVTAGNDVAYAYALLRCGTPQELADKPESRLRLTLGLRKQDGRWVVAHEHHSFADDSS